MEIFLSADGKWWKYQLRCVQYVVVTGGRAKRFLADLDPPSSLDRTWEEGGEEPSQLALAKAFLFRAWRRRRWNTQRLNGSRVNLASFKFHPAACIIPKPLEIAKYNPLAGVGQRGSGGGVESRVAFLDRETILNLLPANFSYAFSRRLCLIIYTFSD